MCCVILELFVASAFPGWPAPGKYQPLEYSHEMLNTGDVNGLHGQLSSCLFAKVHSDKHFVPGYPERLSIAPNNFFPLVSSFESSCTILLHCLNITHRKRCYAKACIPIAKLGRLCHAGLSQGSIDISGTILYYCLTDYNVIVNAILAIYQYKCQPFIHTCTTRHLRASMFGGSGFPV